MGAIASQITRLTIFYSTVYTDADQRKHQSSASLAFVWGIHRGPGNSPHKWPVTRKMFPFDDVIMLCGWQPHTEQGSAAFELKLPHGSIFPWLSFTWLDLEFGRSFRLEKTWQCGLSVAADEKNPFITRPAVNIDVNKIDI